MLKVFFAILGVAFLCQDNLARGVYVRTITGSPTATAGFEKVALKEGAALPENAVISTGEKDLIVVYFDETTRVVALESNGRIRIDASKSLVKVERGEVIVRVRRAAAGSTVSPLRVATYNGITTIAFGDFIINSLKQEVLAISGEGDFRQESNSNAPTRIKSGQSMTFNDRSTPVISNIPAQATTPLVTKVELVAQINYTQARQIMAPMSGGKLPPPISH